MNRLTMVAVVLFALAGCGEGEGNDGQASGGDEKGNETESRCLEVHPKLLRSIETGLTTEGKGTLRDGQAVRSKDYDKVWFVAAELDASGLEGDGDIAVWGTNEDPSKGSSSGLIIRADGLSAEFSDWGSFVGEGSDLDLQVTDEGVQEAKDCVASSQ